MRTRARRFRGLLLILVCSALCAMPSAVHGQETPSAGVRTAFQIGTDIDNVMTSSGLPNTMGLSGSDYLTVLNGVEEPGGTVNSGSMATIEMSAPAYAAVQIAAAMVHFEKEEYPEGNNCLKTAKWALSDKDRAFMIQGGDTNSLSSAVKSSPPITPETITALNDILSKLADPASFFSSGSLADLKSSLGEIKSALDRAIVAAKEYPTTQYREAVKTIVEDGPSALMSFAASAVKDPLGTMMNSMATMGTTLEYLMTSESPHADASSALDPVILYSGEFRVVETDLAVRSVGLDVAFTRTYRSKWERDSEMGYNWTHNFDERLIFDAAEDGSVLFKDETGQVYGFKNLGDGKYEAPYQLFAELAREDDGYKLTYGTGLIKRFDVGGFLTSIEDRHGNVMRLTYETFGMRRMLRKIVDTQGREYVLGYSEGRISSLSDPFGRVVKYGYNSEGDLVSVRSPTSPRYPTGKVTRYNYSGGSTDPALNHNLTMIMDPKGQVYLVNRYGTEGYEKDRVVSQRFGGEDAPEMKVTYEKVEGAASERDLASRTTVIDRLGISRTYEHDGRGLRLAGEGWTYHYNDDGLLIESVSPGGVVRAYRYNTIAEKRGERQNLVGELSIGADGTRTARYYTYGPYNQIATEEDEAGGSVRVTRKEFDTLGNMVAQQKGDDITRYAYNARGQVIKAIRGGITREFVYDGANPVVMTESGGGLKRTMTSAFSGPGYLEGITDALENTTRYWTNERGRVVKKVDPLGTATLFDYDENENLITVAIENKGGSNREEIGYQLRQVIDYDVYDKPVRRRATIDAARMSDERLEYDAEGRLQSRVGQDGVRHEYERNAKGLITAYLRNGKLQYKHLYDADGQLVYEKDGLGQERWWVRNGMGRVIRHVMKDGTQALIDYTPFGEIKGYRVFGVKDGKPELLAEHAFGYDDRGRLIHERTRDVTLSIPSWSELERVYDAHGRLVEIKNPAGTVQKITYDGLGRRTVVEQNGGARMGFSYDLNGRIMGRRISGGAKAYDEKYAYDAKGRVISTDRAGSVERFTYDSVGNVIEATDAAGTVSKLAYDGLGRRLTEVTGERTRRWDWNERGLIAAFTDGEDQATTYVYDEDARLTARSNPDGVRDELAYDVMGRIIGLRQGATSYDFLYDPRDRVVRRSSGDYIQEFAYDGLGRLIRSFDTNDPSNKSDDVTVTHVYDGMGQLVREGINGRTVAYRYDERGRPHRLIYPSNEMAERTFDEVGLLRAISFSGEDIASYDYELGGLIKGERFANGTARALDYDAALRLSRERIAADGGRDRIFDQSYDYDAMRRITRATDVLGGTTRAYAYDNLAQLTRVATIDGARAEDSFDQLWERATAKDEYLLTLEGDWKRAADAVEIAVGKGHRYERVGDDKLEYDDRGNLVRNGAIAYSYDPWNRLIAVSSPLRGQEKGGVPKPASLVSLPLEGGGQGGGERISFTYDAHNRRITKKVGDAAPVAYIYDGWNVIEEYEGDVPTRRYVPGRTMDQPVAFMTDTGRYFYHRDRLGNIVALTNNAGELVERYAYDPYGGVTIRDAAGERQSQSAVGNTVAFTGQRYDAETGLYYFKNRYYSPKLGRFITKDPLGMADGPNLYAYVNNDPTNWTDPMGTEKYAGGGFGGVGGGSWDKDEPNWFENLMNGLDTYVKMETETTVMMDMRAVEHMDAAGDAFSNAASAFWSALPKDIESATNMFQYLSGIVDEISPLTPLFYKINEVILGEPTPYTMYGESYWNGRIEAKKAKHQMLVGECEEDPDATLLGTGGSIGLGFTGVDIGADIRDIACKIKYGRELNVWDFVAFLPFAGALKNVDNAAEVFSDSAKYIIKHLDETKRLDAYAKIERDMEKIKALESKWALDKNSPLFKQSQQAAGSLAEAAKQYDKKITPVMSNLVKDREGVKLVDLSFKFKEEEKIASKISKKVKKGDSLEESTNSVKDALRYTIVVDEKGFGNTVNDLIQELEGQGFKKIKVRNAFVDEGSAYNGINTAFETKDGFKFEVQFHTESSQLMRSNPENHAVKDMLDQFDAIPEAYKNEEIAAMGESMEIFLKNDGAQVPIPIDVGKVKDFDIGDAAAETFKKAVNE